jgi:hypothetical protein
MGETGAYCNQAGTKSSLIAELGGYNNELADAKFSE